MDYKVVFVADEDLPETRDWVLVRIAGAFVAFIKRSRVCPEVLAACWRAFVEGFPPAPAIPAPRDGALVLA